MYATVLADLVLILFPVLFLYHKKKDIKKGLGLFSLGFPNDIKKTSVLLALLLLASAGLTAVFFIAGVNDLESVGFAVEKIRAQAPLLLVYLLVVRVFSEEIFFRGFLVERIGVFGSSAVFALAHVFYLSITEVVGAFVLGAVLAIAFKRNQSLVPNILAHMLYNFTVIALLL